MPILDTSALLNAFNFMFDEETTYYTAPDVLEELKELSSKMLAEQAIERGKLKVLTPNTESIKKIEETAKQTGDYEQLSSVDTRVLALCLEHTDELWTDDYAMQNIAKYLKIPYKPIIFKGIKRQINWRKKCPNCGKIYDYSAEKCEFCDKELIRTSK